MKCEPCSRAPKGGIPDRCPALGSHTLAVCKHTMEIPALEVTMCCCMHSRTQIMELVLLSFQIKHQEPCSALKSLLSN